jgi:hypothetical protein
MAVINKVDPSFLSETSERALNLARIPSPRCSDGLGVDEAYSADEEPVYLSSDLAIEGRHRP